jgi:hypothetical protein
VSADERQLFARLRRLRRESAAEREPASGAPASPAVDPADGAPAAEVERAAGVPDWLRARLGRGAPGAAPRARIQSGSIDPPARLAERPGPRGAHAVRVEARGRDERHGAYPLGAALGLAPDVFAPFARDGSLARVDLERAVYLDIETTGLSGGAGTYPFLVALGGFTAGGFEVWQGFLRDPEEEEAMLAAAAERIAASSCIVSFFGKSFDRHRLEDKMRLFGIEPPFANRPHLDLYHPCARLYAPALPDGRLQTMERELCRVTRADDLPGAYAPEAWFDFLARRPHRLEAVFQHNLDDVLSLVTLAAHLGRTHAERGPDGEPLAGPPGHRAWGLARLAADRGDHAQALAWCERALERLEGERRAVRWLRACALRRLGAHARANAACEELTAAADEVAVAALIALAKDAEHRRRDARGALVLAERAAATLERGCTGAAYARHARDLERRLARLRARCV